MPISFEEWKKGKAGGDAVSNAAPNPPASTPSFSEWKANKSKTTPATPAEPTITKEPGIFKRAGDFVTDKVSDIPAIQKFAQTESGITLAGGADVLMDGDISLSDKTRAIFDGFGGFGKGVGFAAKDFLEIQIPKALTIGTELISDNIRHDRNSFTEWQEDFREGLKQNDPEKYAQLYPDGDPVPEPDDPNSLKNRGADAVLKWAENVKEGLDIMQKERFKERGYDPYASVITPDNFGYGLGSGASSIAAYAGISYITRNPAAATGFLGWLEGSATYDDAKNKIRGDVYGEAAFNGTEPRMTEAEIVDKATQLALIDAGGIALLEKVGMDALFRNYAGGRLKNYVMGAVTETIQETTQTVWSNGVEKYGYDQTKGLFDDVTETMILTLPIGFLAGGITGGTDPSQITFEGGGKEKDPKEDVVDQVAEKNPNVDREYIEQAVEAALPVLRDEAQDITDTAESMKDAPSVPEIQEKLNTQSKSQVILDLSASMPATQATEIVNAVSSDLQQERVKIDLPTAAELLETSPKQIQESLASLEQKFSEDTAAIREEISSLQEQVKNASNNSQEKLGAKKKLDAKRVEFNGLKTDFDALIQENAEALRNEVDNKLAELKFGKSEKAILSEKIIDRLFQPGLDVPVSAVIQNEINRYQPTSGATIESINKTINKVSPSKDQKRNKALADEVLATLQDEKFASVVAELSIEDVVEQVAKSGDKFQVKNAARKPTGKAKIQNMHKEDLVKILKFIDLVRRKVEVPVNLDVAVRRLAERYGLNQETTPARIANAFDLRILKNKRLEKMSEDITAEAAETIKKKKADKKAEPKKRHTPSRFTAQLNDIQLFKHVPAKMVKEIMSEDGRPAFGRFYQQMVEFTEDADVTTIPHEAFHVFSQMALSDSERQIMYKEARKAYGRPHASDFDLEETLAQDFAEYYVDKKTPKTFSGKLKDFFKRLATVLSDMVTGKSRATIESIFADVTGKRAANRVKARLAKTFTPDQMQELRQAFYQNPTEFTLRLFENKIFEKESIGYQETLQAVKSMNLKKGENLIHEMVLERPEFKDMKKFDAKQYKRTVLGEMIQFRVVESDTYSEYGTENVNLYHIDSYTYILDTNFAHGKAGHFGSDELTGLHSHFRGGIEHEDSSFKFLEMQSDVFQQGGAEFTQEEALEQKEGIVDRFVSDVALSLDRHSKPMSDPDSHLTSFKRVLSFALRDAVEVGFDVSTIENLKIETAADYINAMESLLALSKKDRGTVIKQLTDSQIKELSLSEQFNAQKNSWHELNIRTAIRKAAEKGALHFDMADTRTVANIEGYVGEEGQVDATAATQVGDYVEYLGNSETLVLSTNHPYSSVGIAVTEDESTEIQTATVAQLAAEEIERYEDDQEFSNRFWSEIKKDFLTPVIDSEKYISSDELRELALPLMSPEEGVTVEETYDGWEDVRKAEFRENLVSEIFEAAMESDNATIQRKAETFKEETLEKFEKNFDATQYLEDIYGSDTVLEYTQNGTDMMAWVTEGTVYEAEISYGNRREDDFSLDQISDSHARIAAKYGVNEVDGKQREGDYYKYLKKIRPDLEHYVDDEGWGWWRTEITKDDSLDVPLYQTKPLTGDAVAREAEAIGTDGGYSDWLLDKIKSEDYTVVNMSIETLRKNDPSLDEFIEKGKPRKPRGQAFEGRPIVDSQGEVWDGYSRIAQYVKNGKDSIEVYKGKPAKITKVGGSVTDSSGRVFAVGDSIKAKRNDGDRVGIITGITQSYLAREGKKVGLSIEVDFNEALLFGTSIQLDENVSPHKLTKAEMKEIEATRQEFADSKAFMFGEMKKDQPLYQMKDDMTNNEASIFTDLHNRMEEVMAFMEATIDAAQMSYVYDQFGSIIGKTSSYPDWIPTHLRDKTVILPALEKYKKGIVPAESAFRQVEFLELFDEQLMSMLPIELQNEKVLNDYIIEQEKVADALRVEAIQIAHTFAKTVGKRVAKLKKGDVKKVIRHSTGQIRTDTKEFSNKLKSHARYYNRGYKTGYKTGAKEKLAAMLSKTRAQRGRSGKITKLESIYRRTKQATKSGAYLPIEYQERLTALFDAIDFTQMRKSTREELEKTAAFFESQEGEVPKNIAKKLERLAKTPVGAMTDEQLSDLLDMATLLFENGVLKKKLKETRDSKIYGQKLAEITEGSVNLDDPANASLVRKAAEFFHLKAGIEINFKVFDPARFADIVDGMKNYTGATFRYVIEPIRIAIDDADNQINGLLAESFEEIREFGGTFNDEEMARMMYTSAKEQGGEAQADALAAHYKDFDFKTPLTEKERGALEVMKDTFKGIRGQVAAAFEVQKNIPFPDNPDYFPFAYDRDVEMFDINDNAFDFTVTKTAQGFTMHREQIVNRVLDINIFDTFSRQVSQQLYYANVQPSLSFATDVFNDPTYRKKVGKTTHSYWESFVGHVATRGAGMDFPGRQFMDTIRGNISTAILGYKLSTVAIQPSAVFDAMIAMRKEFGQVQAMKMLPNMLRMLVSGNALNAAIEQSRALQNRQGGQIEIAELRGAARGQFTENKVRRGWNAFKQHAYDGIRFTDMRTAAAVFDSFLSQYVKQGLSLEDATLRAEQMMMLSQSSANVVNRPQILNNSIVKFFTPFQTFIINSFNNIRYDAIHTELKKRGNVRGTIHALANMQFIVYAVMYEAAMYGVISDLLGYEDDEEETWMDKIIRGFKGRIPLSGYVYDWSGEFDGLRINNPGIEAVSRALIAVYNIREDIKDPDKEVTAKDVYDAIKHTMVVSGVPGTQQVNQIIKAPRTGIGQNLGVSYDDRKNSEKRVDTIKPMLEEGKEISADDIETIAAKVYGSDYTDGDIQYRTDKKAEVIREVALRNKFGFDNEFVNVVLAKDSNNEVKAYFAANPEDLKDYRKPVKMFGLDNSLMSDTLYKELMRIQNASPEDQKRIVDLANAENDAERAAAIGGDKNFAKRAFSNYKIISKVYYESI